MLFTSCLCYAQKSQSRLDTVKGVYNTINASGAKIAVPCWYVYSRHGKKPKVVRIFFVNVTTDARGKIVNDRLKMFTAE